MSVLFGLIEWEKLHSKSEKRLLLSIMGRGGNGKFVVFNFPINNKILLQIN
tara:strand:+ start:283 stop:435 length:153 start_codon:yes stop_codon:yes gene_type:complete